MATFLQKYRMAVFSVILFIFFALVIHYTHTIRLLVQSISVDARFWPRVIGWSGCVFSVILFIQSVLEAGTSAARKETGADASSSSASRPVFDRHAAITLGLIFLYVLGLQYLGFFVMTLLYLFFQFYVLTDRETRDVKRLIVITVLFTPLTYAVFRYVFQMMLPTGTLWTQLGGMS